MITEMTPKADIGVVGLGVMGSNLVLNMDDHGYVVAVWNRTASTVDDFLGGPARDTAVIGTHSLEELVASLAKPRRILLMVKSGSPVEDLIGRLQPMLDEGDIIIDGGNSLYTDTIDRARRLEAAGLAFIGAGISGGEAGARTGPSIMPAGTASAWPSVRPIFQDIAADVDGTPCCEWIGSDGAGHFVKTVHNGIEYGDMQVLAEAYDVMHRGLGLNHDDMSAVFARWNDGPLDSYLVEITAAIMKRLDTDGTPLLEKILDRAGQKGTGKWAVKSSMDLGEPTTIAAAAVYARIVSSLLEQRRVASSRFSAPAVRIPDPADAVIRDLHDAVYASKIVAYAQGFMILSGAAAAHGWDLDFASIASMWRGGCIIRSRFLGELMDVFAADGDLGNILVSDYFAAAIDEAQPGWRRTVNRAVAAGIAVPAYSAALAFFDGYRSVRVPANLIQAQRDFFGAHTYERVDGPPGELFHTDWD
jgi:6-phosphogluconate dehydrogenase